MECHLPLLEKNYNEFDLLSNKQSTEEVLIQSAVKTTIHLLYDKMVFNSFRNAYKVPKVFLFVERRRPDWLEVNGVIQWLCS